MSNRKTRARQKSNANDIFYANKNFSNTVKCFSTGGKVSTKKNFRNLMKSKKSKFSSQLNKSKPKDKHSEAIKKNSLFNHERWMHFDNSFQGWNMVTDLICNTEDFYFKNIMDKIAPKKAKFKSPSVLNSSIRSKKKKSSYGKSNCHSLVEDLSDSEISSTHIHKEGTITSLNIIEEKVGKSPFRKRPFYSSFKCTVQPRKSKFRSLRRQHLDNPAGRVKRKHRVKESATQVFNKIICDISNKKSRRKVLRTIEPVARNKTRNIKSSQGPRHRMKLLELGRPKMVMTPERQSLNDFSEKDMETYKEKVVEQMRKCQSPIQVLKMSKVLCAPYFSFSSPTQKSVTKHLG
ncbi:unnamed protein product [Moneuplotes crassus]|uniref:Uncharacterized protein n=1 Tax=Euplotes crassus TaxID=5936 RepID=A0AAD1UF08_EUPCR|nr:unnamed protein product [Moneuplotes crassus]